jgi:predicted RNA-binding Zn-ribbon protein involved in translation (DUF1610 family)
MKSEKHNEMDLHKFAAFCPACNYAIEKIRIMNANYDYLCPNCDIYPISYFSSLRKFRKRSK